MNSSPKKHRCRHFEQDSAARPRFRDVIRSKRFSPNGFRQDLSLPLCVMTAFEPYNFEPNKLQTPKIVSRQDSEVDNSLEKGSFADLVKDAKFSFPPISSRTE